MNPLYQSGTIAVALLGVLIVTGLWLLLFYRLGTPYESVARLTASPITGNWVRGLHRYASDAALLAVVVHLFRMLAQGRSWGPRALAWVSGVGLFALLFVCGWTGYVMVWDEFGIVLAREGARMMDSLPIFSEPVVRAFSGERPVATAFFFVNMFAHVALPLGLAVGLWLHVSRVSRATLLPPRRLMWGVIGLLTVAAVAWPLRMGPEASAFTLPESVSADMFYSFWMPFSRRLPGGVAFASAVAIFAILALVPAFTRRIANRPAASKVDEALCGGCVQCTLDCPYGAIQMIPRPGERGSKSAEVARVNPALCVSCGICAGSCAPMAIGPAGRTGRDQLTRVKEFLRSPELHRGGVVVVGCDRSALALTVAAASEDAVFYPVDCAGSLHTSVIELIVRAGMRGVLVAACPPRDCWNREGPKWVNERIYNDREAELQARVDRRRVRLAHVDSRDIVGAREVIAAFAAETAALDAARAEESLEVDATCVNAAGVAE